MQRTRFGWLSLSLFVILSMVLSACATTPTTPPAPTSAPQAQTTATSGTSVAAPTTAPAAPTTAAPATTPTAAQAAVVKGGTFIDSSFADAKTMQPLLSQDNASTTYINLHYNAGLLRYDPKTAEPAVFAAKSYKVSDDKLNITVQLREDLQWSDGKKITATDYKFTWDKMMDEKVNFPYRQSYKDFESLTAEGDYTLVFKLKSVFAPALNQLMWQPIPKHVFESVDVNDNPMNNKPTVGSGPFLLKEWRKDELAEFVANDKFHMGRPNLDTYIVKIVADTTVQFEQFKSGGVDSAGVTAVLWEEAIKVPHAQPINYYAPGQAWTYIGYNLQHPILKNKEVRQAFSLALDVNSMIKAIRLGHARPIYSVYPQSSWAYNDSVPKFTYDVKKANDILDKAGWARGADGIRAKDGQQMKMRIFFNNGNKEREQIATIAQEQLKEIGVQLEVIPEEWNAYLDRIQKTKDVEMFVLGWVGGLEPFTFGNIVTTNGGQNDFKYSNPEVDQLYEQSVKTYDINERRQIYGKIQQLIAEDQIYTFLWENEALTVFHNRFVFPYKLGESKLAPTNDVWKWYSKTGK